MLENLIFSLNRVSPFFLLIVLGAFLRGRKLVAEEFFQLANKFTFRVALPVNMFLTIAVPGERIAVNPRLLVFAAAVSVGSFLLIWLAAELMFRDKTLIGTLVQGGFRGNFALLGVPLVTAVGGETTGQKAAFVMLVVIPIYNALSVVVLKVRSKNPGKPNVGAILKGVITNPLIISILLAIPFFALEIHIPYFADRTLRYISGCATPLGLLSIGGLLRLEDATSRLRPALFSTVCKVFALPLVTVPLAYLLGFRGDELLVLFIMAAAPGAVSAYPMACEMGGDGPLAANSLILTTLLSAFVFAGGIYLMRSIGWI